MDGEHPVVSWPRFPKSNRQLGEMYDQGRLPSPDEFAGEYAVHILTGPVPSGRAFGHRKRYTFEGGRRENCNVLFRDYRFGYFSLADSTADQRCVVFDYDDRRNTILRRMRDHVRGVGDGAYLGSYNLVIGGRLRFVGFFAMVKLAERQ